MGAGGTSRGRGRLERVRALAAAGHDADTFRRSLRAHLRALVPFDGYCVNTTDPHTLAITSSVGDGLDAEEAARLFAIEHAGTDVNRLVDLARTRVPVATIGGEPARSERMRRIFLPRGWNDELRAALVEHGRCWGYLHLFRRARFTAAEQRVVASLVKDLAKALRVAATAREASLEAPAVLTFTRDGRLSRATSSARDVLDAMPTDAAHGGLPHALVALAADARARGAGAATTIGSRRGLLRAVALPEAGETVVIVDAARRADLVDATLARHALSPRERDVCRAMLEGHADKTIATSLAIGLETVKAHARSAFAKLEVSGRGGLLAKLAQ